MAFIWNIIAGVINGIIRIGIKLYNLIALFANFFANVFNDPVSAILNLFANMFGFILGIVQATAKLIDTVLGSNLAGVVENFGNDFADAVKDLDNISNNLQISEENLKYLRDLAEQEAVNRFTIAKITIEQNNTNNIKSEMDLDGVISGMTDVVNEAISIATEGVH